MRKSARPKRQLKILMRRSPRNTRQIEQASKQVAEAQATFNFARDENTRYQELVEKGAGTVQRAQQAASDF